MFVRPTWHDLSPSVEGANGRYLISYGKAQTSLTLPKPNTELSSAIAVQRLDWPHIANNGFAPHGEKFVWLANTNLSLIPGDCAYDFNTESHWVVTAARTTPNAEQYRAIKVGYQGSVSESNVVLDIPGFQPHAGGICFDEDKNRFPLAYGVDNNTASNTLWGNHVTYANVTTPLVFGPGCGGTERIAFSGSQHIGDEFGEVHLLGAGAGTAAFLAISLRSLSTPLASAGMPGCVLSLDPMAPHFIGTLFALTGATGRASVRLPIPGFANPDSVYFQWFMLDPSANRAGVTATRGLQVRFNR